MNKTYILYLIYIRERDCMKRNSLINIGIALSVIILFIGVDVVSATTAPSNDEVEIRIYAGLVGNIAYEYFPWGGKIGFGTCYEVINNRSESVIVYELYEYWTLSGKYLGKFGLHWTVPPHYIDYTGSFGWPWRAVYLKITVEAGGVTASRSGFSFFNFVILGKQK